MARHAYAKQIKAMSSELRTMAERGKISWMQAAEQATTARNIIMDITRSRTTPVGLAIAQKMKSQGKTINEIIALKTQKIYGKAVRFENLSVNQKNNIYIEIVKSAAKSRPEVTSAMRKLLQAGRGLVVLSLAMSA